MHAVDVSPGAVSTEEVKADCFELEAAFDYPCCRNDCENDYEKIFLQHLRSIL